MKNSKSLCFTPGEIKSDELGKEIGVTGQAVRKWIGGSRLINCKQLISLVDFFDCSIEFIIGRTDTIIDYKPQQCPPFYERLREIMAEKDISYYRFVNDTRFKEGFIDKWKKGSARTYLH